MKKVLKKVFKKFWLAPGFAPLFAQIILCKLKGKHEITMFLKVAKTRTKSVDVNRIDDVFGFKFAEAKKLPSYLTLLIK